MASLARHSTVKPLQIKKRPSALCLSSFSSSPSPDEGEFPFTPQDLPTSADELGSWGTWSGKRQKSRSSSDVCIPPFRCSYVPAPSPSSLPNISICSRGYLHLSYGPWQARPALAHSRSHVNLRYEQSAKTDLGPGTARRYGRRASLPSLRAECSRWPAQGSPEVPPVPSLPPAIRQQRHRSSSSAPAVLRTNTEVTRWKPLPPTPESVAVKLPPERAAFNRLQEPVAPPFGLGDSYRRPGNGTGSSAPPSPRDAPRFRAGSVDTALDVPRRPSLESHASAPDRLALSSISSRRRLSSSGGCALGAPLESQPNTVKVKVLVTSTGDLFALRLDAVFGALRDLRRALMLRNAVSISTGALLCFAAMQTNGAGAGNAREEPSDAAPVSFGAVIASDTQLREYLRGALQRGEPLRLEAF
ncbi:hypothetical protein AURDEDRAFT_121762 [Auricularia subglabra TFB-10046 SS5]|nr:hypothetical protein AURDEDRAFT_121762 [Auricularia subglabra TFB-10046 SS5]